MIDERFLYFSKKAESLGIDNTPPDEVRANLSALVEHILEPVMAHFGGQVDITSGYRCEALNQEIGGAGASQHCTGEAVDFGIIDTDIYDIACFIRDNLTFDQLIMENRNPGDFNKGWVHVSYCRHGDNRGQVQTYRDGEYVDGLVK